MIFQTTFCMEKYQITWISLSVWKKLLSNICSKQMTIVFVSNKLPDIFELICGAKNMFNRSFTLRSFFRYKHIFFTIHFHSCCHSHCHCRRSLLLIYFSYKFSIITLITDQLSAKSGFWHVLTKRSLKRCTFAFRPHSLALWAIWCCQLVWIAIEMLTRLTRNIKWDVSILVQCVNGFPDAS